MGGGGFLLLIHDDYRVWPKSIEGEGRWRDMMDIFFIGGGKAKFTYDNSAKIRAARSRWEWNDSTITEHNYQAGHIGMQMEGSATEWRNIRVRAE
jgi:hypothetical protein